MKGTLFNLAILFTLLSIYSCGNSAYIFTNKADEIEIEEHKGALVGNWVLDQDDYSASFDIQKSETLMTMQTPIGEKIIQGVEPLGEHGFVIQLKAGEKSERIMAKFKSYQRTTLLLMNTDGLGLSIDSELPVTLRKVKEETVLSASSLDN